MSETIENIIRHGDVTVTITGRRYDNDMHVSIVEADSGTLFDYWIHEDTFGALMRCMQDFIVNRNTPGGSGIKNTSERYSGELENECPGRG